MLDNDTTIDRCLSTLTTPPAEWQIGTDHQYTVMGSHIVNGANYVLVCDGWMLSETAVYHSELHDTDQLNALVFKRLAAQLDRKDRGKLIAAVPWQSV